jgi:hypothetical protein
VTPKPTPTKKQPASLGGTCGDLLPVIEVGISLGHALVGSTSFIVGVPEPNIGRLARLDCQYGLAKKVKGKPAPVPNLEIGISLYDTIPRAAQRVQDTVGDYQSHGATPTNVTVGAFPGTVLVGYGAPTLVVAAGPRTVAVTASAKLMGRAPSKGLIGAANFALTKTVKFSQGGAAPSASNASPSSTPS